MDEFESTGELKVSPSDLKNAQLDFISFASSKTQIIKAMKDVFKQVKTLLEIDVYFLAMLENNCIQPLYLLINKYIY